jgi:hypothetical protein
VLGRGDRGHDIRGLGALGGAQLVATVKVAVYITTGHAMMPMEEPVESMAP